MIQLENVHYHYQSTPETGALEGINLSIRRDEYILICGGSGSGKTTLGYLFNGLIPHFLDGVLLGVVSFGGVDTRKIPVTDFLRKVGMVLQNTDAQLFNSTVESEIAFGLESLGLTTGDINQRIQWIADTLNIQNLLDRHPTALSGGEKCMVAIAAVLCLDPPMMVLDEPFAHLDWESAGRLREALRDIQRAGKTLVVIEQRIGKLIEDVTRCIILEQGKLLFDGSPEEARPILMKEHLIPCYPALKKSGPRISPPLVSARELCYETNHRQILNAVSFDIRDAETLAILGRNGAGKTTLIKHINGLLHPTAGNIRLMGQKPDARVPAQTASLAGISFQNPNDQFFKTKVRDELQVGLKILGKNVMEGFEDMCSLFGLQDLLDRSPHRLSEGQKKRLALASVAIMHPRLLILDEPTAGQDGRFLEATAHFLASLKALGFTIVMVTHDFEFAAATAERWILLEKGKVIADGPPEELLKDGDLIACFDEGPGHAMPAC